MPGKLEIFHTNERYTITVLIFFYFGEDHFLNLY